MLTRRGLRNLRDCLLPINAFGPTYVFPNLLKREISKDLYFL